MEALHEGLDILAIRHDWKEHLAMRRSYRNNRRDGSGRLRDVVAGSCSGADETVLVKH
jgi:hypothetical protein